MVWLRRHLSAEPLRQFGTGRRGNFRPGGRGRPVRAELGPAQSALRKAFYEGLRQGWVTEEAAEKLAIAFGRTPEELWGRDWFDEGC